MQGQNLAEPVGAIGDLFLTEDAEGLKPFRKVGSACVSVTKLEFEGNWNVIKCLESGVIYLYVIR